MTDTVKPETEAVDHLTYLLQGASFPHIKADCKRRAYELMDSLDGRGFQITSNKAKQPVADESVREALDYLEKECVDTSPSDEILRTDKFHLSIGIIRDALIFKAISEASVKEAIDTLKNSVRIEDKAEFPNGFLEWERCFSTITAALSERERLRAYAATTADLESQYDAPRSENTRLEQEARLSRLWKQAEKIGGTSVRETHAGGDEPWYSASISGGMWITDTTPIYEGDGNTPEAALEAAIKKAGEQG